MAAYRRVYDSRHLPRTGISSGTLRSVIEHGLPIRYLYRIDCMTDCSSMVHRSRQRSHRCHRRPTVSAHRRWCRCDSEIDVRIYRSCQARPSSRRSRRRRCSSCFRRCTVQCCCSGSGLHDTLHGQSAARFTKYLTIYRKIIFSLS